jgi:hypothetical protein
MATQTTTSAAGKKASNQAGRRSSTGSSTNASSGASERDDTYGLISVIYHALQGAETCNQYVEDARRSGNDELVNFFEQARDEQNRRALLGRRLLAGELQDVEEEVDELLDEDAGQS